MADRFRSFTRGFTSPLTEAFSIAPDDAADLAEPTRALMVATAGDVAVRMLDGSSPVTVPALQLGVLYPLRVSRVLSTGTTASGLLGLV